MSLTLLEVLRSSTAYLNRVGVPRARLESELLIAHGLGVGRLDLYLQFERPLGEEELAGLRSLLRERAAGVPVAYLVGEREFFGLAISVGPGALVPRPESELLVELALARLAESPGPLRVADLGTGSGCLAVAIASGAPQATVDATDLSEDALGWARRNVARHRLEGRVEVLAGSWAGPLRERGPYHLVVSNPPYVTSAELAVVDPGVGDHEPRLALDAGPDGLLPYRELLPSLDGLLAPGASLLLELDPGRAQSVSELVSTSLPGAGLSLHRDLTGRERALEVLLP